MKIAIEMHAIFSGRVQGVGFRATVRALGRQAKLTGSVENLPDGRVEILAQGTREQLDQFLQAIEGKFSIQSVDTDYFEVTHPMKSFDIL